MIQTRSCPNCLRQVDVSAFGVGSRVRCPYCRKEFAVQADPGGARRAAPKRAPSPSSSVRLQVEGFERLQPVGKGAMGAVYSAYQSNLRRKVALKVLAQEHADKPGFLERFQREAATGARIAHRNVVRVYDILTGIAYDNRGAGNTVHVISMEFVDGPHLRRLAETEEPRLRDNIPKALDLFRQICSGVAAAHNEGVVHRDLKPENIMLDRESGVLKVADFGLAYFIDRDAADRAWETRTRMTMGTVAYMPPEQSKDAKRVVASGDVYSLGRILYELLTGTLPDGAFTAATKANSNVPEGLDEVIARCLQPKPEDRFQSAGELLEAFEGALHAAQEAATVPAPEAKLDDEVPDPEPAPEPSPAPHPEPPALAPRTPVARPSLRQQPLTARYPLWLLIGGPLVLGLLVGALIFGGGGEAQTASNEATVWLLKHGAEEIIDPRTVVEGFSDLRGGLWARTDRFLDHRAASDEATIAQTAPATARGRALSAGALNIERRIEWEPEGDDKVRRGKLGTIERLVAVGFATASGESLVGIDASGDCFVQENDTRRSCGLGRPVATPARISLRQVRDRVEITVDNKDVLPERLMAPTDPATLLLKCQNQRCRFDPKRR